NRLGWNIFKSHPRCVERELFSDAGYHVSFPLPTMLCAVRLCKLGRNGSRQAAEYRAFHRPRPAGVIIEKRSAGDFSRGKESADHIAAGVFDLAFFRNAAAADVKGNPHRKG